MQIDLASRPPRSPIARAWFRLAKNFAATLRNGQHEPGGQRQLDELTHESLAVPALGLAPVPARATADAPGLALANFNLAEHLLTVAAVPDRRRSVRSLLRRAQP